MAELARISLVLPRDIATMQPSPGCTRGSATRRVCGIFWLERPPEDGGPAMPEVIR